MYRELIEPHAEAENGWPRQPQDADGTPEPCQRKSPPGSKGAISATPRLTPYPFREINTYRGVYPRRTPSIVDGQPAGGGQLGIFPLGASRA